MAATPESSSADPEAEPFSPSIFLDLPATPRPRPDGSKVPPSSDDLVLPFISRILMEEDTDEQFFYHQYPDHPALLTAQLPFAQILFDATAGSSSDTNTSAATLSLSDHPIQFSQSPPYTDKEADNVGALFLPAQQDGASAGLEQSPAQLGNAGDPNAAHSSALLNDADEEEATKKMTTLAAGDTLASAFFGGQNGETMDMLKLAFLKGMEVANKFLPSSNSLLMDPEAGTTSSGQHQHQHQHLHLPKQKLSGGSNGRARKNRRNWDVLEAESGRSTKLMVPEPEETDEVVDEMIIKGYDLCLKEMNGLRISMGSKAAKKKKKKKTRKGGMQSSNNNEGTVDLSTLLIQCARAVATDNRQTAKELLGKIKQHSSPKGDATQRLAHCFAVGLEARQAGTGSELYKSLMAERVSAVEYLKCYWLYLAACCFVMTMFNFANMTICKTIAGRRKVHIVDYGIHYGIQWPSLLAWMATWEGGPPEVRITGIDLPQPGFRPAARLEDTGRRLKDCARQFGVPFKFHSIAAAAKWETIRVEDLNIKPDEVLVVNSIIHFGNLMDEGVDIDSPSPRDVVLGNIQKMKPNAFILSIINGSYSSSLFVSRFREVLFHYSTMFDMLDATAPRDSRKRFLVERGLFRHCALNVVACEGLDRVERPETYKQWQARNHRVGLRQLPLDLDIVKAVREKVRDQYHKDFVIDVDNQWLLQGWKGRILYAMSTWVSDE